MGRKDADKITAKQSSKGKSFTSLCYSADGESILAGGHSKFVCIYCITLREQVLLKKFEISCNLSLDAMEEFLDRRKMTEFGSLSMVDEGAGDGDGVEVSLPGVRRGDMSSRHFKPEIRVSSLHFSPTGECHSKQTDHFNPQKPTKGGMEVLEALPHEQIPVVCSTLPDVYVEKLLAFVGATLENSWHLQFYLTWAQSLLTIHGQKLKNRSGAILPTIQSLQKSIQRHHDDLSKLCDWNIYALRYAVVLSNQRGLKRAAADELSEEEEGSEEEDDLMSEPLMTESDLLS
ncbi:hypothetical protein AALO_G00220330 [Alosa alosa]|uniref:Small-subunit processome Utp12 domain-containing protein n=1 Tax=Alosa alosa TaxID=278164 RepID=A0AAV6FXL7_9TELE|nr:hypothetical protein AALO_G00220330 [Alosa alosa]